MICHQIDKSYSFISIVELFSPKKKRNLKNMDNRKFKIIILLVIALAVQSHSRHIRLGKVRSSRPMEQVMPVNQDDCSVVTHNMQSVIVCPPDQISIVQPVDVVVTPRRLGEIQDIEFKTPSPPKPSIEMVQEMIEDLDRRDNTRMRSSMPPLDDLDEEMLLRQTRPLLIMRPERVDEQRTVRMRSSIPYDDDVDDSFPSIMRAKQVKERHLRHTNSRMRSVPFMDLDMDSKPMDMLDMLDERQPEARMRSMQLDGGRDITRRQIEADILRKLDTLLREIE